MKNLAKFLLFVLLLSAGISLLYDYRLKHGGLKFSSERTPEKYTLATESAVSPKQVPSLESLSQERRALVKSVVPSVVALLGRWFFWPGRPPRRSSMPAKAPVRQLVSTALD